MSTKAIPRITNMDTIIRAMFDDGPSVGQFLAHLHQCGHRIDPGSVLVSGDPYPRPKEMDI